MPSTKGAVEPKEKTTGRLRGPKQDVSPRSGARLSVALNAPPEGGETRKLNTKTRARLQHARTFFLKLHILRALSILRIQIVRLQYCRISVTAQSPD